MDKPQPFSQTLTWWVRRCDPQVWSCLLLALALPGQPSSVPANEEEAGPCELGQLTVLGTALAAKLPPWTHGSPDKGASWHIPQNVDR